MLRLGLAVRDITPALPVFLSGYAHRESPSWHIHSPLGLRVFAFEDKKTGERAAVVSADLIGWDATQSAELERWCGEQFGTSLVILNATHTHSGPCVMLKGHRIFRAEDKSYFAVLDQELRAALREAFRELEEVQISVGHGIASDLLVNRRLPTPSGIKCRPNAQGERDEEVTLWRFDRNDGSIKAFWIHLACHPTILSGNEVSSEYPGELIRQMEEAFPGVVCAFLQGCAGDIRPDFSNENGDFQKTTEIDLKVFSRRLFECVFAINQKPMGFAGEGRVLTERRNLEGILQMETSASLAAEEQPAVVDLRMSGLRLAERAAVIAFSGEPSVFYQRLVKSFSEEILPLGYSNGLPGYLPTAKQIEEGGYESFDSCPYFSLPGPFQGSVEEILCASVRHIHRALFLPLQLERLPEMASKNSAEAFVCNP